MIRKKGPEEDPDRIEVLSSEWVALENEKTCQEKMSVPESEKGKSKESQAVPTDSQKTGKANPPPVPEGVQMENDKDWTDNDYCDACFRAGLPSDHDDWDEEFHEKNNILYVEAHHEGLDCDNCGEKNIQGPRYLCTLCGDLNLCACCH